MDENPVFQRVTRISLMQTFACMRLTLWDTEQQRLIGFSDLPKLQHA
jgi:hypothetical protein